jgi:hypothetical protein
MKVLASSPLPPHAIAATAPRRSVDRDVAIEIEEERMCRFPG